MTFPKLVVHSDTLAVVKLFSPDLGVVLVDGYDHPKGTVINKAINFKEVPYDIYKRYDNAELDEEYARKMLEK